MSYYPQFAALLNQQLAKLDRTPAWLARRLGVNGGTVSRWLNDGARPGTPETVIRIADILGLDAQRDRLLVAAGYGYQEGEQAAQGDAPLSLLTPSLATAAPSLGSAKPPRSNLPQPFTPFIGRTTEVAQLTQQLLDPACRLLTLVGPGGIGKTRLAIEVAQRMLASKTSFADGLFFVSLIELNAPVQIGLAIAEALELTLDSQQEINSQLLNYLRNKLLLVVLDNFEHLQEGAEVVSQILANAPQVKVLVTSRVALGLPGEWYHQIAGLAVPEEKESKLEELAAYDSIRLFQQCAQQASPAFDLSAESQYVARICRLVDGMPLAIELAAAWLRLLPCVRIAQELEQNLALLSSPLRNPAPRHRSMHFVLEQSWQMLTEHEAAVLEVLTLFQSGFDDAAAIEVAETDLVTLAALAQKSMIRPMHEPSEFATAHMRYTMHELLRQFASAQAAQRPAARSAALQRHSGYYLRWLQRQTPQLLSADQHVAMALILADFDNLSAAWQWAVEHQDFGGLALALDGLYHFCHIRGRTHDGALLLQLAIDQLQAQGAQLGAAANAAHGQLLGKILARMGALYADLPDPEHAMPILEQSLAYQREPLDRAFVLGRMGHAVDLQGNKAQANRWLQESLAISRASDDLVGEAYALHRLYHLEGGRGEYRLCVAVGRKSLALYRALGRPDRIAHVLSDMAVTECCLGEYATATAYVHESLAISRRLGYRHGEAWALHCLGFTTRLQGDRLEEAAAYTHESMAIYRSTGQHIAVAMCLGELAAIASARGAYPQAVQLGQESMALTRTFGHAHFFALNLTILGEAQIGNGDLAAARHSLKESVALAWPANNVFCLVNSLYYLAELFINESRLKQDEDALALQCQALAWLVFLQHHPACWHIYKEKAAQFEVELAAVLPAQQVAAAQERGKMLNLSEVVDFVLHSY